jgi:anti-sigma regulatory factor (Ser/Thr protein kinase)
MEDLSLHVLDIAENATSAGASLVQIHLEEDPSKDSLRISVRDNGRGMKREMLEKACDPLVTTRTTRRVGLGLSLLEMAAQQADGELRISSEPGVGTDVEATFRLSHIDRKAYGDFASTMITLIVGSGDVDFVFESNADGREVALDTRQIKESLGESYITSPEVLRLIRGLFE